MPSFWPSFNGSACRPGSKMALCSPWSPAGCTLCNLPPPACTCSPHSPCTCWTAPPYGPHRSYKNSSHHQRDLEAFSGSVIYPPSAHHTCILREEWEQAHLHSQWIPTPQSSHCFLGVCVCTSSLSDYVHKGLQPCFIMAWGEIYVPTEWPRKWALIKCLPCV